MKYNFNLPKQGQNQSGPGGGDKKDDKDKKKKYEPPIPTRVGKKKRKAKGPDAAMKLPQVTPHTRCRLKLLKLERIKDYLLMEEEFIRNQERLKPQEEKTSTQPAESKGAANGSDNKPAPASAAETKKKNRLSAMLSKIKHKISDK